MGKKIIIACVSVLLAVGFVQAVPSGSYDGEYQPDNEPNVPVGQSLWTKTATGGAAFWLYTENTGVSKGSISFYDQITTGRTAITRTHGDVALDWGNDVANTMYEFRAKLFFVTAGCFQSVSAYPVYYFALGMFEPGGKCISLGWFDDKLMWVDHTAAALYGTAVEYPNKDYRDGQWHEIYVKKYYDEVDAFTKVDLYVDGGFKMSRPYSAFKPNGGTFYGFLAGGATPAKCNVFADYIEYGPSCTERMASDINKDCVVDINDFSGFTKQWLRDATEN